MTYINLPATLTYSIRKGGFRTKKEATITAAEIEAQLSKGIVPHLTPVPIDQCFDKWQLIAFGDIASITS
ncbi:Arm DNA-binding domain-containing protein [Sutcliffiella halmapala]|uniref:Arm DNA-binding domain-containing protein n=1 Tax=Sutcliffiella halmapala TaxID=79882 RepID=UPI002E262A77